MPREWAGAGGAMLSRFRYTGQAALPELQLYHYKARVYDPALGRFLQTDPIGYEDDLNLYAYVRGDPLNNIDPTGRCAAWLAPAGGAALAEPSPIGEVAWAFAAAGACVYRGYRVWQAHEAARIEAEAIEEAQAVEMASRERAKDRRLRERIEREQRQAQQAGGEPEDGRGSQQNRERAQQQFDEIVRDLELDADQQQRLHQEITGQNLDRGQITERAREMFELPSR